jgi:LysR family transcriptional regulator (chromosome initiation inhibitor)
MTMLDYSLQAALAAVVREGSVERAAKVLHVTPSAVSQRIRLLEERIGQVLVVRGQPCTATAPGRLLCRHAEQVGLLELDLHEQLPGLAEGDAGHVTLRVAVNADSLATWFVGAAAAFAEGGRVLLDISLDDQDHTAERLRSGDVIAAVCSLAAPVQGCRSVALGSLRYVATASPAFMQRHFAAGVNAETLAHAPCLTFNQKDRLQALWMTQAIGTEVDVPRHWLPSSQAFVDASVAGLGWGMNPLPLVAGALARSELVPLLPGHDLRVPLTWQHHRGELPALRRLTDAVVAAAKTTLDPA